MNHIKYLLLKSTVLGNTAVAAFFSVFIRKANAATLPGIPFTSGPLSFIEYAACQIAIYMFWILIPVAVVMVLVAAYQYLTSSGDPQKVGEATKKITWAAVAIIVAMFAKGFPAMLILIFAVSGITPSEATPC